MSLIDSCFITVQALVAGMRLSRNHGEGREDGDEANQEDNDNEDPKNQGREDNQEDDDNEESKNQGRDEERTGY